MIVNLQWNGNSGNSGNSGNPMPKPLNTTIHIRSSKLNLTDIAVIFGLLLALVFSILVMLRVV
jgi:hypothetical protein